MDTAARMTQMDGKHFTAQDFEKAGGLKGAIDGQAEGVLGQFPEEQVAIQRLFQRLTDRGDGERPVRNPEALELLAIVTGLPAARLASIVKAFVENGLLVTRPVENGETEVDLPHECIAWKWKRLAGWIEKEAADAKSLRFLRDSKANRQWLVGSVLEEAIALRAAGRLDLTWAKRYLSGQDCAGVSDWIVKSEGQQKIDQETLRRQRERAGMTAVAAMTIALFVSGLAFWALGQKSAANLAKLQAETALAQSYVQDGMARLDYKDRPIESGEALAYFALAVRTDSKS